VSEGTAAALERRYREAFAEFEARRYDVAETIIVDVLKQASGHAPSYALRGAIWMARGDAERAALNFAHAVRLDPASVPFRNNLGQALARSGRTEQALAQFDFALDMAPDDTSLRANLAVLLRDLSRPAEAEAHLRHALRISPRDPGLLGSLGNVLNDDGRAIEAEDAYRAALRAAPESPAAGYNLALHLMRSGQLEEGFDLHENRWRLPGWKRRSFGGLPEPSSDLSGQHLLVWGEQGLGDEILFSGGLQALLARGARVTFECEARMVALFSRSLPDIRVVAATDPPSSELMTGEFTAALPVGSLPRLLGVSRTSDFARLAPALVPDRERVTALRRQYRAGSKDLLVGLSWRSGASAIANRKSAPLALWREILAVPGIRFVDLQYGDFGPEREAVCAALGVEIIRDQAIDPMADLDGFAAQVAAMDRVITISNAGAHIAGALGIPGDVLLSTGALWHWFAPGGASPHYPSLSLHRQQQAGDWSAPLAAIAARLAREADNSRNRGS
jgi:tetratricopeptide (TPR) repeat protein